MNAYGMRSIRIHKRPRLPDGRDQPRATRVPGTNAIDFTLEVDLPGLPIDGTTRHFATVGDLRTKVEDARVYGGDHWETGGIDGTRRGDELAKWALKRYVEPVKGS